MKTRTFIILFLLLALPSFVYFYVTRGSNNFITLDVIGEQGHEIPEFSFINQNNEIVVNDSFSGKIYVANFFFTSCPTICPIMTKNMAYVQKKLSMYPNIRFISHTVDPLRDNPNNLLLYVKNMRKKNIGIDLKNWDFVTGSKEVLNDIAQSYLVTAGVEDSLEPGGFTHSEYFILIDKEGRVRSGIDNNNNAVGGYDGTNEIEIENLINDIKVLMAEYKKPSKD